MTHDVFSILSNSANDWSMQVGSVLYYPKGFFPGRHANEFAHPKLPLHAWSDGFSHLTTIKPPKKNIQSNHHPIKTMHSMRSCLGGSRVFANGTW